MLVSTPLRHSIHASNYVIATPKIYAGRGGGSGGSGEGQGNIGRGHSSIARGGDNSYQLKTGKLAFYHHDDKDLKVSRAFFKAVLQKQGFHIKCIIPLKFNNKIMEWRKFTFL